SNVFGAASVDPGHFVTFGRSPDSGTVAANDSAASPGTSPSATALFKSLRRLKKTSSGVISEGLIRLLFFAITETSLVPVWTIGRHAGSFNLDLQAPMARCTARRNFATIRTH